MTASDTASGSLPQQGSASLRLDKWLWHARFFKSRSLAAKFCQAGRLRVNGEPTQKAAHTIRVGDVLTFPIGAQVRVVRVLALGERRGPAPEARALYGDLVAAVDKAGLDGLSEVS
jgi:ribosome-associated heat shock protein Hsp15